MCVCVCMYVFGVVAETCGARLRSKQNAPFKAHVHHLVYCGTWRRV